MDQLKDTISNISIYDVKAYVRKAQNVVMNYTETEARVREATNNEPWGASSTLMKEIAQGTNFSQEFHEIMPMIYKRFTEKSASEWRQIYKALQLLEFLVKNGSERVVDYARSHLGVIEMLKHFHYIDSNGKDQGINIRNRAKELNNLLNDVDKIRAERKKARANLTKYGGVGSDDSGGFGGTGKKYGGFGSDTLQYGGGYEGQVFGDGGGFNGSNYIGPGYSKNDDDEFEEYQVVGASTSRDKTSTSSRQSPPSLPKKQTANPVADFISFDDEPAGQSSSFPTKTAVEDDDEFDDFQSATPVSKTEKSNSLAGDALADLFASSSLSSPPPQFSNPASRTFSPPAAGNFAANQNQTHSITSQVSTNSSAISSPKPAEPKKIDAFGDLWSSAAASVKKNPKQNLGQSASLASMAQESAKKSMWGSQSNSSASTPAPQSQNDDLLSF